MSDPKPKARESLAHLPQHVRRVVLAARGERDPGEKVRRRDRPRCGAKTRKGTPCQCHAIWDKANNRPRNGRCKFHGGMSTGPKTAAGIAAAKRNLEKANAVLRARWNAQRTGAA